MSAKTDKWVWSQGAYRAYLAHDKSKVFLVKVYGTQGRDRNVRQWADLDYKDTRIPKCVRERFSDTFLLHNMMVGV